MVKIRVDLMKKLQQFPLLPYRWSKNLLGRNRNNYLAWNSQLRRNGNKPVILINLYETMGNSSLPGSINIHLIVQGKGECVLIHKTSGPTSSSGKFYI